MSRTKAHYGWDGLTPLNAIGREQSERNAYNAESLINRAFNKPSPSGLWNPSWAQIDQQTQDSRRLNAVDRNAKRATKIGESLK